MLLFEMSKYFIKQNYSPQLKDVNVLKLPVEFTVPNWAFMFGLEWHKTVIEVNWSNFVRLHKQNQKKNTMDIYLF